MRAIVQRVTEAQVVINERLHSEIKTGFLVLLGVEDADDEKDAEWLAQKILSLRVFDDREGKMNLSLEQVNGELLVVSQFTLFASTKKGNRPSFIRSAKAEKAIPLYEYFLDYISIELKQIVKSGVFGAEMKVKLLNDGPVTIIYDTKNKE